MRPVLLMSFLVYTTKGLIYPFVLANPFNTRFEDHWPILAFKYRKNFKSNKRGFLVAKALNPCKCNITGDRSSRGHISISDIKARYFK